MAACLHSPGLRSRQPRSTSSSCRRTQDFGSVVLGQGKGSFQTLNTFATIEKTLPNGTYFWRVRAIDKRDDARAWSRTRTLTIAWSDRPRCSGRPAARRSTIRARRWCCDGRGCRTRTSTSSRSRPTLRSPHRSSAASRNAFETSGTVFALPGTLAPGRYYWAVTPEDSEKHKGVRSAVSSFDWSWPTGPPPGPDRSQCRPARLRSTALVGPECRAPPPTRWRSIPRRTSRPAPRCAAATSPPGLRCLRRRSFRTTTTTGACARWTSGERRHLERRARNSTRASTRSTPTIPNLHLRDNQSASWPPGRPPAFRWSLGSGSGRLELRGPNRALRIRGLQLDERQRRHLEGSGRRRTPGHRSARAGTARFPAASHIHRRLDDGAGPRLGSELLRRRARPQRP